MSTHDCGGLLDVVTICNDLTPPSVNVIDVGLFDHWFLWWSAPLISKPTFYVTTVFCQWNQIDIELFRAENAMSFWRPRISAESWDPCQMWQSVDALQECGRVLPSTMSSSNPSFDAKIDEVRASSADTPLPTFTLTPAGCSQVEFHQLGIDDVITAVWALPVKHSVGFPLPTQLFKENVDLLAPFLKLFNRCLSVGYVPASFKEAYITPLLKKPDLVPAGPKSYRLIANLSVLSK